MRTFFLLCLTLRSASLCLQEGKLSDVRRMGAGFAAGVTEALLIVTPFEVKMVQGRGCSEGWASR